MSETGLPRTVQLDGALTVNTADSVRERLLAAMADRTPIEVDISGASEIDLSIIQLLIAARRAHPLTLRRPVPDLLIQVLRRGGFLDDAGLPCRETAFLIEGE